MVIQMVIKMKAYHITFLLSADSNICTGKRYESADEIQALIAFRQEYPNSKFLYIASEDMFNYKY